jgi:branched-subunit amino acid permease
MTWLLIGVAISVVLVIALAIISCNSDSVISGIGAVLLGVPTIIALITIMVLAFDFKAAEYKAAIINREYKTQYTRDEVFYGHDVIDTIRQLDRKRVELNGDIIKDLK